MSCVIGDASSFFDRCVICTATQLVTVAVLFSVSDILRIRNTDSLLCINGFEGRRLVIVEKGKKEFKGKEKKNPENVSKWTTKNML